jgi:hypothetical protein
LRLAGEDRDGKGTPEVLGIEVPLMLVVLLWWWLVPDRTREAN